MYRTPINQLKSRSIVWFLLKRHADHIVCISGALTIGYIIGTKI